MINSLLAQLEKRMKAYDDVHQTFGFLSELMSLNSEQIEDKAKNLVSAYPADLEDTLTMVELIQFVPLCGFYAHSETSVSE